MGYCCRELVSFSVPLYCLLLSWCYTAVAATAFPPPPPPPSSANLAAQSLRTRGYSLFASVLSSLSTSDTNFSGTLLAPPDFAFSFATAKFLNNRGSPQRPSVTLLLYHTLKPPLVLTWNAISSREDGDELRTLYNNNCLFLFRNPFGGEVLVSPTPYKNPVTAVKIRQPDLYVEDHLTIHGIDGILDPKLAAKCSSFPDADPVADNDQPPVKRSFLDHAMRELRRRGFSVVAAAMSVRRSELLSLTSVTIFAVSDRNLFLAPGGFKYDFLHHVLPTRVRFDDLSALEMGGTEFDTLAPNKIIRVHSVNGAISADGLAVNGTEIYLNSWISVMSVKASLDDLTASPANPPLHGGSQDPYHWVPSPAPLSVVSSGGNSTGEQPPGRFSSRTPSPAVELDGGFDDYPTPTSFDPEISAGGPSQEPVNYDFFDPRCDVNSTSSVEGGDLFCPTRNARELTEQSQPLDSFGQTSDHLTKSTDIKIFENVNIADDLFFYT